MGSLEDLGSRNTVTSPISYGLRYRLVHIKADKTGCRCVSSDLFSFQVCFGRSDQHPLKATKIHWTVDGLARSPLQHLTARKDYTLVAIFHLLNENTKNPTNNLLSAESDTQTFQAFKRHNDRLLATSPTRRERPDRVRLLWLVPLVTIDASIAPCMCIRRA